LHSFVFHPKKSDKENILTLINIIFLLLIFFIVTVTFKVSELFSVKVSIINVAPAQSKTLAVLMNTQGEFTIGLKASKGLGLTRNLRIHLPESSKEPWVILKGDANANDEKLQQQWSSSAWQVQPHYSC
tara:strand:- start:22 stop:408 length:387 start_codon:yes stop_codon:yes gene_type:complete